MQLSYDSDIGAAVTVDWDDRFDADLIGAPDVDDARVDRAGRFGAAIGKISNRRRRAAFPRLESSG